MMNTTTAPAATGPGYTGTGRTAGRRRGLSRYHPILFGLITLIAIVLIGLTAWQHHEQSGTPYGHNGINTRLDFLIFLSVWTTLFGAAYIVFAHTGRFGAIASHASHVFWLFITWVMWLVGAALYHHRLNQFGCGVTHKGCQINSAIKGLSWAEFALCFITMWIIILHIGGKTERYRTGPYDNYA